MTIDKEELYKIIKNESHYDKETGVVSIGNLIEIKLHEDENCMDIYKYQSQEVMEEDEDYDFDEDYLTSVFFGE